LACPVIKEIIVQFQIVQMVELAKKMLAKQQDYSLEADKLLPPNRALCSYGSEAWIVDTLDDVDIKLFTKIERVV
jgi:hypothetical protein